MWMLQANSPGVSPPARSPCFRGQPATTPGPAGLFLSAALATFCFLYQDQPLRLRRSRAGIAGIRHHKVFWVFIWWKEF